MIPPLTDKICPGKPGVLIYSRATHINRHDTVFLREVIQRNMLVGQPTPPLTSKQLLMRSPISLSIACKYT